MILTCKRLVGVVTLRVKECLQTTTPAINHDPDVYKQTLHMETHSVLRA